MSRVEQYIQDYTKNCSNVLISVQSKAGEEVISYNPWLIPDHARAVAEIAREEVMEKAKNFIEMLSHGFTVKDNVTKTVYTSAQLLEDFKKYMEE